jgi:carbonic anhydrase
MTSRFISIRDEKHIPEVYRNTPVGRLFQYHNLGVPWDSYEKAELLIMMCMDGRQILRLPKNFSFVVRNSGARLQGVSFSVSFAIACGGIRYIVVIGHSDCRMVNLESSREEFVRGLSEHCGWKMDEAEKQFLDMSPHFKKKDAAVSVTSEVRLIRSRYPGVVVAPLFYSVKDDYLCLIEE